MVGALLFRQAQHEQGVQNLAATNDLTKLAAMFAATGAGRQAHGPAPVVLIHCQFVPTGVVMIYQSTTSTSPRPTTADDEKTEIVPGTFHAA